jgi:hypothetical protein
LNVSMKRVGPRGTYSVLRGKLVEGSYGVEHLWVPPENLPALVIWWRIETFGLCWSKIMAVLAINYDTKLWGRLRLFDGTSKPVSKTMPEVNDVSSIPCRCKS